MGSLGEDVGHKTGCNIAGMNKGVPPEVTNINATAGSTSVPVTFSQKILNNSNFTDGVVINVNGSPVSKTVSGDGATRQLIYTLGSAPSEGDTVQFVYTAASGTIASHVYKALMEDDTASYSIAVTGEGWDINKDFEAGTPPDNAQLDGIGFDGTADQSYYSSSQAQSGSISIECNIDENNGGGAFGKWGGSFSYSSLSEGEEIWYRIYAYFPTGFDFTTDTAEGMKFMRINVEDSSNNSIGYHHNFIHTDGSSQGRFYVSGEVWGSDGNTISDVYDPYPFEKQRDTWLGGATYEGLAKVPFDQWVCFEQYVKFHPTPGQGIRREWVDGTLVFEDRVTGTLPSSTHRSDFIYQFTYWNGTIPQTQKSYIDNVKITSRTPSGRDNFGNPFIGL